MSDDFDAYYEDEDFNDTIIEVSSIDEPAALLEGLKRFHQMARPIDKVVDEDRLSIRLQLREPSGRRIRDDHLYARVIKEPGAAELVSDLIERIARHYDPYDFYFDEEEVALHHAAEALLSCGPAYYHLVGHYLNRIEAQAGTDIIIDNVCDRMEQEEEKIFCRLAVIGCNVCGDHSSFWRSVLQADSIYASWLAEREHLQSVVAIWKKADAEFKSGNVAYLLEKLGGYAENDWAISFIERVQNL